MLRIRGLLFVLILLSNDTTKGSLCKITDFAMIISLDYSSITLLAIEHQNDRDMGITSMPSDFADQAQNFTEQHLERSLNTRSTLTPSFSGFCISCKEPVVERRFCDSLCREEHERTSQARFRR
jgi:hypothetical protein